MMDRPCRSSSRARVKTSSAPSPVIPLSRAASFLIAFPYQVSWLATGPRLYQQDTRESSSSTGGTCPHNTLLPDPVSFRAERRDRLAFRALCARRVSKSRNPSENARPEDQLRLRSNREKPARRVCE